MDFHAFATRVRERFDEITDSSEAFLVAVSKEDLWEMYLSSFPEGSNPVFRERTEHDCATCRQFVKAVGGLVTLDGQGGYRTVWDLDIEGPYGVVASEMAAFVRSAEIDRVFRTRERAYGKASNEEVVEGQPNIIWHHFHCEIPHRFVVSSVGDAQGVHAASFQVLGRGLEELSISSLETVLDLIGSNSLYRGEEHERAVRGFLALKRKYDALSVEKRKNFVWANLESPASRFRNTAIGTLVQDLSEGMALEMAVARFESKVAPHNYRRSSAPITKGMIDRALGTLRDLGLEGAVHRRFATLRDVRATDVLFVDRDVRPKMKGESDLTSLLMEEVRPVAHSGKGAIEVSGEVFFGEVLPGAESLELELTREHLGNFVSLTAPAEESTGRLFQWDNDFAWVYDGDAADSIRQRVKAAGGKVDGFLRVSLSWFNGDDLDIHCEDDAGLHIYFGNKCGVLDVDMNAGGVQSRTPVENLAWDHRLREGSYKIWVNQFCKRESVGVGFEIEYEHLGDVKRASYGMALRQSQNVQVCVFEVRDGRVADLVFSPAMSIGSSSAVSTEKWGICTGQKIPVEAVMLSPNHWGPEDQRRGNRHHIFSLQGCRNPSPARGFFNEYLRSDLHEHRKVFEVLGSKLMVEPSEDQISGVGFSSTRHDRATFIVRKDGATRAYTVQF